MRISIRAWLYGVVSLLTLALVAMAAQRATVEWADHRLAVRGEADNATADLLLLAAGKWALERGRTNTALNAPAAAAAAEMAAIAALRHDGDAALAAALTRLESATPAAVADAEQAVAALRRRVDHDLGVARDARDTALAAAWVPGITNLIERSQALRLAHAAEPAGTEARLDELQHIKHLVWVMSEFAGRERATVGALIARGGAMPVASLELLAGYRGRVDAAWDVVSAFVDRPDTSATVRQAAAQVRDDFFGRFQQVRAAVHRAAVGDAAYPVDAAGWVAASTAGIDRLLALNAALGADAAGLAAASAGDSMVQSGMAIGLLGLGLLLALASLLIVGGRVVGPLHRLALTVRQLAAGDLATEIAGAERRDEIGGLAAAVQVFKANAIEKRRLEFDQSAARERAAAERVAAIRAMADVVENEVCAAMEQAATSTRAMADDANGMAESAARVTANAGSVAAAADETQEKAAAVSAAGEQLSASIREISSQVCIASAAAERGVDGGRRAEHSIRSLAEAGARIGAVVGLIRSVAEQTNLLALNATIEAARAGEAGRGFAVVASEVKALAGQTASSVGDIVRQIAAMDAATREAIGVVGEMAATIDEVSRISAAVAAAVEEQAAATAEIASNVTQTSDVARAVSTRIAAVADEANHSGLQAARVRGGSSEIRDGMVALKQTIVRLVRTATDDANRRREPRYRVDAGCRVRLGAEAECEARLADVSWHGALLKLPTMAAGLPAPGTEGDLRLRRGTIPVAVTAAHDAAVHLRFAAELPPDMVRDIDELIAAAAMAA